MNQITITFEACEPAPANGYRLRYRPVGGSSYTTHPVNFTTSPIVITENTQPDGTLFEGFIEADCGGYYGPAIPFTTEAAFCIDVEIPGGQSLPDAEVGVPYDETIILTGTAPFVLSAVTKPAWATLTIVGNSVNITGTPDAEGTDVTIEFTVTNCETGSDTFTDTIDVTEPGSGLIFIDNQSENYTIVSFVPAWFFIDVGSIPLFPGNTADGGHSGMGSSFDIEITGSSGDSHCLVILINGIPVHSQPVTGGGTYTVPPLPVAMGDNVDIILQVGACF